MAIEILLEKYSLADLLADEFGDDLLEACYAAADEAGIDAEFIDITPAAGLERDIANGANIQVGFGATVAEAYDKNGDCIALFYINQ
jgi:3-oxoacyl-[acyl-carrier-protein] synthase III